MFANRLDSIGNSCAFKFLTPSERPVAVFLDRIGENDFFQRRTGEERPGANAFDALWNIDFFEGRTVIKRAEIYCFNRIRNCVGLNGFVAREMEKGCSRLIEEDSGFRRIFGGLRIDFNLNTGTGKRKIADLFDSFVDKNALDVAAVEKSAIVNLFDSMGNPIVGKYPSGKDPGFYRGFQEFCKLGLFERR